MSSPAESLPRRWLRRWPVLLGIGMVLTVGATLAVRRPFTAKVVTTPVERRLLREEVEVSGAVESRFAVTLKAESAGPITHLAVPEGDRVAARTPLLVTDAETARLQLDQTRRNVDAQIAQAAAEQTGARRALTEAQERRRANLRVLAHDVDRARTALTQLDREAAVSRRLLAEGAVAQQSSDQLQTQLFQARIALKTAEDNKRRARTEDTEVIAAENRLHAAETALGNARRQGRAAIAVGERTLAKTTLRAPFAGTVTDWLVTLGDYVGPGTAVAVFQDLQALVLELPVDETDLPKMRRGGPVEITFDAYPDETFTGRVRTIGKASTRLKDVMVFPVQVDFADPRRRIKPGMSGDATIIIQERPEALAVPLRAVRRDGTRYLVTVQRGKKGEEVALTPGIITLDDVEVVGGLQEGDLIVLPAGATPAKR